MKTMVIILSFLFLSSANAEEKRYNIYTGHLPPYSFEKKGKIIGVVGDVLSHLLRKNGIKNVPTAHPWLRTLSLSENKKRVLVFPMGRIPEREDKYLWVGPVLEDHLVFTVLNRDKNQYKNVAKFKNIGRIGVLKNAHPHLFLKERGFENLDLIHKENLNFLKLERGRIEALFSGGFLVQFHCQELKIDPRKFRVGLVSDPFEIYIALSPDLADLAEKMQEQLDEFKKTEEYQKIFTRYGLDPQLFY